MQRVSGAGTTYVGMTNTSYIWSANEAASVDGGVSFGTGTWIGVLDYTDPFEGGFLDTGETMKVEIGSLSPEGVFTKAMEMIDTGPEAAAMVSVAPSSEFIVPKDHYLALKLTVSGYVRVDVNGAMPGSSYIASPTVDPGYPVPELSTIILTSTGLLALLGYVGYRRRDNE